MKKATRRLGLMAALYLAVAAWGLVKEARGDLRCTCEPDCWCKKPGLRIFLWVFPFGHSLSD